MQRSIKNDDDIKPVLHKYGIEFNYKAKHIYITINALKINLHPIKSFLLYTYIFKASFHIKTRVIDPFNTIFSNKNLV